MEPEIKLLLLRDPIVLGAACPKNWSPAALKIQNCAAECFWDTATKLVQYSHFKLIFRVGLSSLQPLILQ